MGTEPRSRRRRHAETHRHLTENARLFAETRKLLGSGGKVFEVVEDEQEQAPEVVAEFYPASVNGSSAAEGAAAGTPSDTIPVATAPQPTTKPLPPESSSAPTGGNGSAKPPANGAASPPAQNSGNGSAASSGFKPASQRVPDGGTPRFHDQEASHRRSG